ncbi:hypothetical protein NP493_13g13017 [Ridgeia piscesae]|uniref:Ammonium transporter AmtB-like domain-containing protein n=1 Tax=Ridgeia piscesae TaxID=27915 RepID=A0AAD9PEP6_RIDPI|nr:hypothetical protein NP493_13g13017 [Ridgeia piscesae]
MAERVKLHAYSVFSFLNTIVYCFPAHWVFSSDGWLHRLGMVDVAGGGPVHLLGAVTGLVATVMLRPRLGRYDGNSEQTRMACPTNALLGMFMLWWGWLGFNCGSTLGVSKYRWKLAARSAVSTTNSTTGGGLVALLVSYLTKHGKIDVSMFINGVLGSLVAITPFCALATPWQGLGLGAVGGLVSIAGVELLEKLKIDDPVGCVGVHGFSAVWGLIAAGLFTRDDDTLSTLGFVPSGGGLLYTGNFQLLGVQLLGIVVISAWTASMTFVFLKVIDLTIGLRVSPEHERLGADAVMHGLLDTEDGLLPSAFGSRRKSCALHHEKTLWEHPLEQCSDAAYDNTELTPPPKTESFRRGSFLRNTLSHVVRRRESTCGTMPSYWSPGLRAQAGSRGRTQRNADFVSQSTEIGRFSSLRVNGLRQTQDVTLYL